MSMEKDYENFVARMGSFDMDIEVVDVPNEDDQLKHYGILGMKWGIRRFQPYPKGKGSRGRYVGDKSKKKASSIDDRLQKAVKDGSATITTDPKTGKRRVKFKNGEEWDIGPSSDFKKSKKQKPSPKDEVKQMTDTELRQKINRLQMEKQYAQLTEKDKTIGVKVANSVLRKIGNKVVDRVIDRTIVEPIDKFIKGKI